MNIGANVPNNVAFASVVNLTDEKKNAKWIPRKIPDRIVNNLIFKGNEPWGLKRLYVHKIIPAIVIRANAIGIASISDKYLTIIAEELTDKRAMNNKIQILKFEVN